MTSLKPRTFHDPEYLAHDQAGGQMVLYGGGLFSPIFKGMHHLQRISDKLAKDPKKMQEVIDTGKQAIGLAKSLTGGSLAQDEEDQKSLARKKALEKLRQMKQK